MDPDDFFKDTEMTFEDFINRLYNIKEFDQKVHSVLMRSKKPLRCEMIKKKLLDSGWKMEEEIINIIEQVMISK